MIAAVGNRDAVVLLDFGTYSSSTGDGGVGNDWALISVNAAYQSLVTPTMAFWGGPRGVFTKTGEVAGYSFHGNNLLDPEVSVNPDPFLAQQIVHYGHGAGPRLPGRHAALGHRDLVGRRTTTCSSARSRRATRARARTR